MDNILRDPHNSLHPKKAEFNNCFIIHSKYFQDLNKPGEASRGSGTPHLTYDHVFNFKRKHLSEPPFGIPREGIFASEEQNSSPRRQKKINFFLQNWSTSRALQKCKENLYLTVLTYLLRSHIA